MTLQNNPFHILNISCGAGRREIVAAADEMGFMLDTEMCAEAQNILINPSKRLSAEIGWFIDVDQQTMEKIQSCIDNDEPIPTDGLTSLSRLNAALYNLSISKSSDAYELGFSIVDIDEQFSSLDIDAITSQINECRSRANMATVQSSDVLAELNGKQAEVRQIITEKLSVLDQDTYISFITHIAEKYVANDDFSDGVILSDVVDQYEVRLQSELESYTDAIEKLIEEIKQQEDSSSLSKEITTLIEKVQEWDTLAQPLQLKSQASGMPHENSEHMGSELRKLALYLHNEKGKTAEALTLVDAMKGVFAELGSLADIFENDSDVLNEVLKDQKEAQEVINELDIIKKEAQDLNNRFVTKYYIDRFIDRIRKLNQRIQSMTLDSELKTTLRKSLCYLARGLAIDLHNTQHLTNFALAISKALVVEFGDILSLRSKLKEDERTLNQQLPFSQTAFPRSRSISSPGASRTTSASTRSSDSSRKGWAVVLVFAAMIIAIALLSQLPSCQTSRNSQKSSNSNTTIDNSYIPPSGYTVTLDKCGGTGGLTSVTVQNGQSMPIATAPSKPGYDFKGYYQAKNGIGIRYYDANMHSSHLWDKDAGGTLYAYWVPQDKKNQSVTSETSTEQSNTTTTTPSGFTISFDRAGGIGGSEYVSGVEYGDAMPAATAPTRNGYKFRGYWSHPGGNGWRYYDSDMQSVHEWDKKSDGTIYAYWVAESEPKNTSASEQKFTTNASNGDKVYCDIVSIFPAYGIYTEGTIYYTHFMCECKTSTGSTVWVYMTCSEYQRNFDSTASTATYDVYADEISFSTSKRIHGTVIKSESILDGLSKKTATMAIDFSSVG